MWLSFWLGIAVSLAANIAAAPTLTWQSVLVTGRPPVALLLAVELLARCPRSRQHIETQPVTPETEWAAPTMVQENETGSESDGETAQVITLAEVSPRGGPATEPAAQEIMWAHFLREQARGRTPTGAELDRIAGTNKLRAHRVSILKKNSCRNAQ